MTKYIIETPNKAYNGVTYGVQFENGIGETEDVIVKNVLVNDFGYQVTDEVEDESKSKQTSKKK
jgi:hypothetical protein